MLRKLGQRHQTVNMLKRKLKARHQHFLAIFNNWWSFCNSFNHVLRWIKLSKSQNKTFSGSYLATMALGDFCCFVHLQLSKLSYYFKPRFLFLRSPHSSKLRWLTDTSWSIFVEKCNNFGLAVFQSKRNWIMVYFCIYHIITVARIDSSFWPLKNYSIST